MITESQVDKALEFLRTTAEDAANARAAVAYTGEWLKVVKASQKAKQAGLSNAAAEDVALTSTEYFQALEGYRDAVKQDSFYRFKREAADAMIRAWQTEQASLRAEGRAYS